ETAQRWAALPPGAPIDALREMATLTAEIICRTVFGPRLGAEHAMTIVASFSEYQRLIGQLDLPYLLGLRIGCRASIRRRCAAPPAASTRCWNTSSRNAPAVRPR